MKEETSVKYIPKLVILEDISSSIEAGKEFYLSRKLNSNFSSITVYSMTLTDSIEAAYEADSVEDFKTFVSGYNIELINPWLIGKKYTVEAIKKTSTVKYEKIDIINWRKEG